MSDLGGVSYTVDTDLSELMDLNKEIGKTEKIAKKGFSNIDESVDKTEKKMGGLTATMTKVAGALATVFAANRLRTAIVETMDAVDAYAKLARSIDTSIVSVQALELAAGDAGVQISVLTAAAEKVNTKISEARNETSLAAKSLERLGLSASDFVGMDVDQKFALIADQVKSLGLSSGQTSEIMMGLGVEQAQVNLLLQQGGDAIRGAREEIEKFGWGINEIDAAKIEAANDALSRTGRFVDKNLIAITAELAPILEQTARTFTEITNEFGGMGQVAETTINYIMTGVGFLVDSFRGWQLIIKGIQLGFLELASASAGAIASILESVDGASDGTRLWGSTILQQLANVSAAGQQFLFGSSVGEQLTGASEKAKLFSDVFGEAADKVLQDMRTLANEPLPSTQLDSFIAKAREMGRVNAEEAMKRQQALREERAEAERLANEQAEADARKLENDRIAKERQALSEQIRTIGVQESQAAIIRLQDQHKKEFDLLVLAREKELLSQAEFDLRKTELARQTQEKIDAIVQEGMEKQKNWMDQLGVSMSDFGNQALGSFMSFATGAERGTDAVRNLALSITKTLIGAMVKSLAQSLFSQKATAASSAATAGVISTAYATPAALVSLASYGANAVPAQAGIAATVASTQALSLSGGRLYGGPVQPGSAYKVTEDGKPEILQQGRDSYLMTGSKGGKVIKNGDIGGGSNVNVIVDVKNYSKGGDDISVQRSTRQEGTNREEVISIIVGDIMDRGDTHRAMLMTTTAGNVTG